MDRGLSKIMAEREFVDRDRRITYTIQVAAGRVEIHRLWVIRSPDPFKTNEEVECDGGEMHLDELTRLVGNARRCIVESETLEEAFGAEHPVSK